MSKLPHVTHSQHERRVDIIRCQTDSSPYPRLGLELGVGLVGNGRVSRARIRV